MVELLSCPRGHYWEAPSTENGANTQAPRCPVCGSPPDSLPLLDLAPSTSEPHAPPPLLAEVPLRDEAGLPVIAGYEILEALGRSPTGVALYRARQRIGSQPVLLEVVFAREDSSQQAWGSLRGEASALGRLHHPNVVQLCEAGERDRQLFYNAVEWVEGPTLADLLREERPSFPEAMALVEVLARAIHQAHEKGIVHRSLKPASILLQPLDAVPLGRRSLPPPPLCRLGGKLHLPRITHFGQARKPIEGEVADIDLQGGLPFYLAPEQAWGRAREIGLATDIHALGALLYELVAGKPPFGGETNLGVLEAIQCREAAPLERQRSRLPTGLSDLCRKCLAKSPRRRYPSALALADDLRRCADGHPIRVASVGLPRRVFMALGRHRYACTVLLLLAVTALSLLIAFRSGGGDGSGNPAWSGPSPFQLASDLAQARKHEQRLFYFHTIAQAERALRAGDPTLASGLLQSCSPALRGWEWRYLSHRERHPGKEQDLVATMPIHTLAVSGDGQYIAAGSGLDGGPGKEARGEVNIWPTRGGPQHGWNDFPGPVRGLGFYHPDNTRLAILSSAGRPEAGSRVELRSLGQNGNGFRQEIESPPLSFLAVMPENGQLAVSGPQHPLLFLDLSSGLVQRDTAGPDRSTAASLLCPVPAPMGPSRIVLASSWGSDLALLSPREASATRIQTQHSDAIRALAWSRTDQRLATASADHTIRLGPLFPDRTTQMLRGHTGPVTGVAFSPDGKRLASISSDGTVKLWDPETGLEVLSLPGFARASAIAFVPPGDLLIIAHEERITILDASPH
jgi:serine/threonine protein kinase/WD40 repeat protein